MIEKRRSRLVDEPARRAALRRYDLMEKSAERAFDEITSILRTVFEAPMAAICLVDAERVWRPSLQGFEIRESPRERSFGGVVIQSPKGLAVPDAASDPDFSTNPLVATAPGVRSYLGMPLITPDGYAVGAIGVMDTRVRCFTTREFDLMRSFAELVIDQIEMRQIASRDSLTGALSRRAFEEAMRKELSRHKREGAPAGLAVFDLDHFKRVNDAYGHAVGDAVLCAAVAACNGVMREMDWLGRIGGEEFAVLASGADLGEIQILAERMRAAIATATIAEQPSLRVTASFGAAACSTKFAEVKDWLVVADANLYAAKGAGRNCCRVSPVA
jgi:diguanylate cyclase (GGDEF)-like protein